MAISTYKVELHNASTKEGQYAKFCDIKDYGDLIGDSENLETTTLSDAMQTYIPGIKNSEAIPFTLNWDNELAQTIKGMEGKESFWKVIFGDGTEFAFAGYPTLGVPGKGVNEVVDMTLSILPSTEVELLPKA